MDNNNRTNEENGSYSNPEPDITAIPEEVFTASSSDSYEDIGEELAQGAKTAQTALTLGIVASSCYFGSYILGCCCCLPGLLKTGGVIVGIIGIIYGILGILRTKEYGVDSKAIWGLVLSALPLLIGILTTIFMLIYYAFSFGVSTITVSPNLLQEIEHLFSTF